jgi:TatA/E family protein of Tat protein translocase
MSVGPMEIIIVLALALLIFGPKRLPEMGRTLGRAAREFRKASDEVKGVLDIGLNDDDSKSTSGAAAATAAAPLQAPALEPWWNETLATAVAPATAPAPAAAGAPAVPGLAGFLGVAAAESGTRAAATADDGSAAPAFASFLGASAAAQTGTQAEAPAPAGADGHAVLTAEAVGEPDAPPGAETRAAAEAG